MSKVVISGTGPELVLTVNGERPQGLLSFRLLAEGPDHPLVLQMRIHVSDLSVETEAVVEEIAR